MPSVKNPRADWDFSMVHARCDGTCEPRATAPVGPDLVGLIHNKDLGDPTSTGLRIHAGAAEKIREHFGDAAVPPGWSAELPDKLYCPACTKARRS